MKRLELQTAAILLKELVLEVLVEFDLREWQPDLSFEYDSMERLKELGNDFDKNNGIYPPGGTRLWESKELLKKRIEGVIDKFLGYGKVTITGHGMAFRALIGEIGGIPHASIIEYSKQINNALRER